MKKFSEIKIGDDAEFKHTITQEDVDKFVQLTGDNNKIHIKKQNKEILNDILGYAIFKFCFLSAKRFDAIACYNYLRLNFSQDFYYIPDTTYLIKFIIKSRSIFEYIEVF